MEFMLLFSKGQGATKEDPAQTVAMQKFAAVLASEGKLRRDVPLRDDAAAARIRVLDGRACVTDGPFPESREVVGGFWIVDVADRGEAIEIARRCPHAGVGRVAVSALQFRTTEDDAEPGIPFLLAFLTDPGLTDPKGEKLQEMIRHGEMLHRERKFLETTPLAHNPTPARVETRGGRLLVTDGPFAETKDMVGGYSIVRVRDRAEAIRLAKDYPHSRWGSTEVREILPGEAHPVRESP